MQHRLQQYSKNRLIVCSMHSSNESMKALNSNVPVDAVKQFEQTISYLEGIDQSTIESESEAEQLRGNIIVARTT